MKKITEIGNTYGKLTVIGPAQSYYGKARWNTECECGERRVVQGLQLRRGEVTDCGCGKAPRAAPTARSLDARLVAVEAELAALKALLQGQAPAQPPTKPQPPAPAPQPVTRKAPKPPTPEEEAKAIERIQQILAIPYARRMLIHDELKAELTDLIHLVQVSLQEVSQYNPGFKNDPEGAERALQLKAFFVELKKFHLDPDA